MTSIPTKLDIAIATYGPDGIQRVASCRLPRVQDVKYVVSWQQHEGAPIPDELLRDDVEIYRFDGVGQSINRNNAFNHCTSEWVMVGDDDLVFRPDGLVEFMDCLGRSKDVDFCYLQISARKHDYISEGGDRSLMAFAKGLCGVWV